MITNHTGLPEPLVRAIARDDYDDGGADVTVTELLLPPRLAALRRQHRHELVEDASERIWSLIGRIGHRILAEGALNELVEHRLSIECLGWRVSGQFDIINGDTISDYKFVSAWSVKDGPKPEWIAQLNLYRLLCEPTSYIQPPNQLEIVAILRDWSIMEARRARDYPQSGVQVFRLPVWPLESAYYFMEERVRLHQQARETLPECTAEDMWSRPDTWALVKNGNKRATSVLHSREVAEGVLAQMNELERKKYRIDFRPGQRVRCENYCAVGANGFCEQWNNYQQDRKASEPNGIQPN